MRNLQKILRSENSQVMTTRNSIKQDWRETCNLCKKSNCLTI